MHWSFIGAVEDSDVHDGENCGAASSVWSQTGMYLLLVCGSTDVMNPY